MTEYTRKSSGLYLPTVSHFKIYIDDGGAQEIGLVGYTILLIDEPIAVELAYQVQKIKELYNLKSLHGRDVNYRNINRRRKIYNEVFKFTVNHLERSSVRLCYSRLGPDKEHEENQLVLRQRINQILKQVEISTDSISLLEEPVSFILLPLSEMVHSIGIKQSSKIKLDVVIHRKKDFDKRIKEKVILGGNISGMLVSFPKALQIIINNYAKIFKIPLKIDNIAIVFSEIEPIIEVVDAIANFSFNFLKTQIKIPSHIESIKSALFEDLLKCSGQTDSQIDSIKHMLASNFVFSNNHIQSKCNKPISVIKIM
jgi:hypothetical protein